MPSCDDGDERVASADDCPQDASCYRRVECGRTVWCSGGSGFGPDGVSAWVVDITNRVVRLQTGYLYHYAFAMLIGVAAIATWLIFGGMH